jgi:hypothetical protein
MTAPSQFRAGKPASEVLISADSHVDEPDEGTFPNSRQVIESMREIVDPEPLARILAGNAAELYDFDLDYLSHHPIPEA